MSVIEKTREDVRNITGGLMYHLDLFRDILTGSEIYQEAVRFEGERVGEGADFEKTFLCWVMFRVWVANRVAWSVQYGEAVILQEDIPDVSPVPVSLAELSEELRHMLYHIFTNAGQYWLAREWYELFEGIVERIREAAAHAPREV